MAGETVKLNAEKQEEMIKLKELCHDEYRKWYKLNTLEISDQDHKVYLDVIRKIINASVEIELALRQGPHRILPHWQKALCDSVALRDKVFREFKKRD